MTRCKRRLVRGGDDDDGFFAAGVVEIAFQKFADFAAALADERNDVHIGIGAGGHHAQQRGFADAAAGENAEALAAAARHERVNGLDAGLENLFNALALERMRRHQVQFNGMFGLNRPQTVNGPAQAVEHAAFQGVADADSHRRAGGGDFAAGMDAMQFAQRHQQQMVVPKPDDLGERDTVVSRGFDAADFPDGGDGAFRFDDQPDDLHDAAARLGDARRAHAPERGVEATGRTWHGGFHAEIDLVELFQLGFAARVEQAKPGLHEAAAAADFGGTDELERTGLGQTLKNGRLVFAQQRKVVGMKLHDDFGGLLCLRHRLAHDGLDQFRGNGDAGDNFLGAFERDLHQRGFGLLDDFRHGAAQRFDDALVQFEQFIPLLEHLFAEVLFAIQPAAFVGGLFGGARASAPARFPAAAW